MCGEKETSLHNIRLWGRRSHCVVFVGSLQAKKSRGAWRLDENGRVAVCGHVVPAIGLESVRFSVEGTLVQTGRRSGRGKEKSIKYADVNDLVRI